MSTQSKDWLSKWLPLVFAVGSNLVVIAYSYGKLEQRLAPIEEYVRTYTHERAANLFVTRPEFDARTKQRDREMDEVKGVLREIDQKLDRIIERSVRQ